ncbi:hypothetical protein UP09_30965 [Bradyrhizobium sp. LTSP885]|uniref:hypothetical protein n=1 Tax=Bradyrhizobium sp. LTSP885 TaxID=1619232 RepID=UPI0005C98691|nr:hypothetical protein [Bradyrhizobium sp. LTSP885]KJC35647.1 hypothetical protein UP09_30965 [Bradyrhizobium sp. LTSP885]
MPKGKFTMVIDKLDIHDHSPRGHRAFICEMLERVKQEVGSGTAASGDVSAAAHRVVGSWEIEGE